ncbi:phage integrase SAM-like domain-containing protein [Streptomyces sp. NBC_01238]|uniref:phage integrase SAM-like domain-containing protein n=1 Tax=unclassified Streptomyces TaxID=2593676 RepID=UPI003868DE68
MEESTAQGYKNALVHVHSYLGYMRLQELTEEHVEFIVAWLLVGARRRGGQASTGLRPSTAQGVLSRLKEALGRAVVRKLVHADAGVMRSHVLRWSFVGACPGRGGWYSVPVAVNDLMSKSTCWFPPRNRRRCSCPSRAAGAPQV